MLYDLTVRSVEQAYTVEHKKPKLMKVVNRPSFGLSLAIDGKIIYSHRDKKILSDESHVIILPKDETYELECIEPGKFTLINFDCSTPLPIDTVTAIKIKSPDKLLALHKKLEALCSVHKKSTYARVLSCFYEIIALIIDEIENTGAPAVLVRATSLIEEKLGSPELSNLYLARKLHISEVYLRKIFASHLGTSPKQYVKSIRIDRAKDMLACSLDTVSSIAESCGYSSVSVFCRAFKERTGLTPEEYRRENRVFLI